jgi:type I restriction enzyme M protein
MFVQSDLFTKHSHQLSFVGQESKDFTYRLCRMNLFIHGLDANIQLGNSYFDDKHATLKADYVLANPPFNDGSRGENGWGANRIADRDPRLTVGDHKLSLSHRNANTMWMLHFLSHLKDGGTAAFVMATGELSSGETARLEVRKAFVDQDYVDCIVQLTGQLFANTQIPCSLWFLSKNRRGGKAYRKRMGEVLFIDGRKLGTLIPGSRKQKALSMDDIEVIARTYRQFRHSGPPDDIRGFCTVAKLSDIHRHDYSLAPGRYVGTVNADDDSAPLEDRIAHLSSKLADQFARGSSLASQIETKLRTLVHE